MIRFFSNISVSIMIFLFSAAVLAGVPSSKEFRKKLEFHPWGWMTMGEIVKSAYRDTGYGEYYSFYNLKEEWSIYLDLGIKAIGTITERSTLVFHLGGRLLYNPIYPENSTLYDVGGAKWAFAAYPIESSLASKLIDDENVKVCTKVGYFAEKYNPEAQNFGEYLFRSGIYPSILVSGFDIADKTKILGIRGHLSVWDVLHQSLFLHSEIIRYPVYDFSLSYLINYNPIQLFDIGAGVSFSHLISVDKGKTTPGSEEYVKEYTGNIPLFIALDENGDSIPYTFSGTKLAGRLTIDPKWFFPGDILGKNDLKLYGEVGVLGLKDYIGLTENTNKYTQFYEDILERMPVMFGFNVPTFKLLDVLALEAEWFGNPFPNSEYYIWRKRIPVPFTGTTEPGTYGPDYFPYSKRDDWKWSITGRKTIAGFIQIVAQAASDHMLRRNLLIGKLGSVFGEEEICQQPTDWYW
ncbi:MAG: hypothetical protein GF350_09600, partial [Chitinivibrionales bacterium]|nr:hypothetical protein [Chitinivibrionales bacterium]